MKLFITAIIMSMSVSAQASEVSSAKISNVLAKLSTGDCFNNIETAVKVGSYLPGMGEIINHNLNEYEKALKAARKNILNNASNEVYFNYFQNELNQAEAHPMSGSLVKCVRPYVNFSGSRADQFKTIGVALNKIQTLKNAAI